MTAARQEMEPGRKREGHRASAGTSVASRAEPSGLAPTRMEMVRPLP